MFHYNVILHALVFFWELLTVIHYLYLLDLYRYGGPDADGRILLRWIFRKWEGVARTGWSWLRIGTGGGHL